MDNCKVIKEMEKHGLLKELFDTFYCYYKRYSHFGKSYVLDYEVKPSDRNNKMNGILHIADICAFVDGKDSIPFIIDDFSCVCRGYSFEYSYDQNSEHKMSREWVASIRDCLKKHGILGKELIEMWQKQTALFFYEKFNPIMEDYKYDMRLSDDEHQAILKNFAQIISENAQSKTQKNKRKN